MTKIDKATLRKGSNFAMAEIVCYPKKQDLFILNLTGGGRIASSEFGQQLDLDREGVQAFRDLLDRALWEGKE